MAYTQFCLRYQTNALETDVRGGPVKLTAERWADLKEVNQIVNRQIIPERNELGLAGETWSSIRGAATATTMRSASAMIAGSRLAGPRPAAERGRREFWRTPSRPGRADQWREIWCSTI